MLINEKAIIYGLTELDLKRIISESVNEALANHQPKNEVKETKLLSQQEAADFLSISQPTIIKWRKQGKIPFHQIPGTRRVMYVESEIINCSRT